MYRSKAYPDLIIAGMLCVIWVHRMSERTCYVLGLGIFFMRFNHSFHFRLILNLDPLPTNFEEDTVEIFGIQWVTETALVNSSRVLFHLFR